MSEIRLSDKIGPAFYSVARDVFQHGHTHYDLTGGRGSLKSSTVSVLVPLILIQNPNTHALVLRKVANTIRDLELVADGQRCADSGRTQLFFI